MLTSVFSFRADLEAEIFPVQPLFIELLDLDVQGTGWKIANSLYATAAYNNDASLFLRSIHGEIIYIFKLEITDSSLKNFDIFTIADSSRSFPIFTERFVDRLKKSKLSIMNFKEVGEIL